VEAIDGFGSHCAGGVEAEGGIGLGKVVVDGLGDPNDRYPFVEQTVRDAGVRSPPMPIKASTSSLSNSETAASERSS